MKENYFIIHGSYGNPYKIWVPWLKNRFNEKNINCIVPSFPTPYRQNYESWSKILNAYYEVGYINENTTIITHSLGSIFLVKYLINNEIKVKKIITVAGFNNLEFSDDMNLYKSFYLEDNKLNLLKKYCDKRISIYSDNDPYVPEKDAIDFANKINSKKVLIKGAGHFSERFGYTEFEEILKYI